MLVSQPCQYLWQREGWQCSKVSTFFANYGYEASSTWAYAICLL